MIEKLQNGYITFDFPETIDFKNRSPKISYSHILAEDLYSILYNSIRILRLHPNFNRNSFDKIVNAAFNSSLDGIQNKVDNIN